MGRIGKHELEKEMQRYFATITDKPLLVLEVNMLDPLSLKLENAIVLYLLDCYKLHEFFQLEYVKAKPSEDTTKSTSVTYSSERLKPTNMKEHTADLTCASPFVFLPKKNMYVAGLSGVLRFIMKYARRRIVEDDPFDSRVPDLQNLLGYQSSCLQACAESSIWTKFCEVDMIKTASELHEDIQRKQADGTELEIPVDLVRFEYHLQRPVRIHNVRKKLQDLKISEPRDEVTSEPAATNFDPKLVPHSFAEGPDLTLADLLLFPCVSLARNALSTDLFDAHLPTITGWFQRVTSALPLVPRIDYDQEVNTFLLDPKVLNVVIPDVPHESLYKSDPLRYKAKLRLFTKQDDISEALNYLASQELAALNLDEEKLPSFEWEELPRLVHPEGGELPVNRIQKKAAQLSNLVQLVQRVYKENYKTEGAAVEKETRIVDFCSGGGHLGILLAYLLPGCRVMLVENKEESLRRAEARVLALGLTNITFYQCNLDYFTGSFNIGVALHACGTATDLVLLKCIGHNASFVCCPCCYGAIQSNHMLHYPRSSLFHKSLMVSQGQFTLKHYFVLGHAADQTHAENDKTEQGKLCMRLVDTDRCLQAQENNYHVNLRIMEPQNCSPKNHILVGIPNAVKMNA